MSFLVNPVAYNIGGGNDPYFSSVVQLCHFDNAAVFGGLNPINSCSRGNTMGLTGSSSSGTTTSPKFGAHCLGITGDQGGASGASHADYNFGTGDFTIEFWVTPDTLARDFNTAKIYFDMRDASLTTAWVPLISANNATGNVRYFANGLEWINGGDVMVAATWQHIALCRASSVTRLFRNGTQIGSNFSDSNTYIQSKISQGTAGNKAGSCIGRFDDLRITKGVGRYTANFTAPTAAFPNQ